MGAQETRARTILSSTWLDDSGNLIRLGPNFFISVVKAKISNAEQLRVHTKLVIGGRDLEAGAVSVRLHHGGPQGAKPKAEVIADILDVIRERRA
jgi:threonyl-tRNA synthetase